MQFLKTLLRDRLGIPPWTILVVVGLLLHVILNLAMRKPMTSPWGLMAPAVVGTALECYEIWVQYHDIGLFAAGNDPLIVILARHAIDVVLMLSLPLALVLFGWSSVR